MNYYCHDAFLQASYIHLANTLRKECPEYKIVVRPHPGEKPEWYRSTLGPLGVEVRTEGSALPWMAAAKVMIHTGCTTALEAADLTPVVIQFSPSSQMKEQFYQYLPSLVGEVCHSEAEVVKAIQASSPPELNLQYSQIIRRIIDNFCTPDMACEKIADVLHRVVAEQRGRVRSPRYSLVLHRFQRLLAITKPKNPNTHTRVVTPKFAPMNEDLLREKLEVIGDKLGKKLQLTMASERLIRIDQSLG